MTLVDARQRFTPVRQRPIRVCHITSGLKVGGAEMMLYKTLRHRTEQAFDAEVISLTDLGPVGPKIQALGVPVRALGMRGPLEPRALFTLTQWLRQRRPDVVQTWMYHADLMGGIAARLAGGIPVAWGVHHVQLAPPYIKRATAWTARACATLSRQLPAAVVYCAEAASRAHRDFGYAADRMLVIPNGFDVEELRPDPAAPASLRHELQLPLDTPLVGIVGRFDPQKDHRTFVAAAGLLHERRPDVHFVMCGDGIDAGNGDLAAWIAAARIERHVHLLGRRADIARINAGLDIATLSSAHEAFPLVIGEAMACGVPCVVTDAGDAALIVGDAGRVVPTRQPRALADALAAVLALDPDARRALGAAARQRIEQHFSLEAIVARYEDLYRDLALGRAS